MDDDHSPEEEPLLLDFIVKEEISKENLEEHSKKTSNYKISMESYEIIVKRETESDEEERNENAVLDEELMDIPDFHDDLEDDPLELKFDVKTEVTEKKFDCANKCDWLSRNAGSEEGKKCTFFSNNEQNKRLKRHDVTSESVEDILDEFSDDEGVIINSDSVDTDSSSFSDDEGCPSDEDVDGDLPLIIRLKKIKEAKKWVTQKKTKRFRPTAHPFTDCKNSGVQSSMGFDETSTLYEIFKYFFDENLVGMIVKETNKYFRRVKTHYEEKKLLTRGSKMHRWVDVTVNEMYCFLAVVLYMGIVRLPYFNLHWSTDPLYNFPFVRNIISSNRFKLILQFLHFSSEEAGKSKAFKIDTLLNYLSQKFQTAYRPGQYITVNESVMLFKGRLDWKQYIKSKRAHFGLKSFDLCECDTGYIFASILCTGKEKGVKQSEDFGLSGKVVLDLLGTLSGQGRTLFLDNCYTSPALFEKLVDKKTNVCGFINLKRKGLPKISKEKLESLKKGQMIVRFNKKMAFSAWKDKRVVKTLTTFQTPVLEEITVGNIKIIKPNVVNMYNKYMGGLDLVDQVTATYPSICKTLKWYKKYFFHVLDIGLHNTVVIYRCLNPTYTTLLNAREEIIREIINEYHQPRPPYTAGRKSKNPTPTRLQSRCFVMNIPPTEKRKFPYKRCVVCAKKKIRKETRFQCENCNVALCVVPCFGDFHRIKNY